MYETAALFSVEYGWIISSAVNCSSDKYDHLVEKSCVQICGIYGRSPTMPSLSIPKVSFKVTEASARSILSVPVTI